MKSTTTKELVFIALFAALISALGYLSIPVPLLISPVPITGQTFGILLAGLLLTPKLASASVGLWIIMGSIGLPVFAYGKSGFGVLIGPTGGYIIGFLVGAFVIAVIRRGRQAPFQLLIAALIGHLTIYIFGVIGLIIITKIPLDAAITAGILPFLIGDVLKLIASIFVATALHRHTMLDF